ncbi:hypothetical protein [Hyunsoonleella rubra]|uniref:Lipoprotein n=1 Tax=Hyunsoonleella rubra TaxID=1737062 RepID=A0ABW5TGW5_9FLAO
MINNISKLGMIVLAFSIVFIVSCKENQKQSVSSEDEKKCHICDRNLSKCEKKLEKCKDKLKWYKKTLERLDSLTIDKSMESVGLDQSYIYGKNVYLFVRAPLDVTKSDITVLAKTGDFIELKVETQAKCSEDSEMHLVEFGPVMLDKKYRRVKVKSHIKCKVGVTDKIRNSVVVGTDDESILKKGEQ